MMEFIMTDEEIEAQMKKHNVDTSEAIR